MGAPLTSHDAQLMQPMRTSGDRLPPLSRSGTRHTLFVPKLVERVEMANKEHRNS
jgi:hypothetical protein